MSKTAISDINNELKEIIENASGVIFKIGMDGSCLYVSPEFGRLCGTREIEKLIGSNLVNFVHPDDVASCFLAARTILHTRKPLHNIIHRILNKEGNYLWFSTSATCVFDELGQPLYGIGLSQDITDRKKTEELVLKEKELLDSIINSLPGIFYILDTEGNLLRWNQNFENVTGYNAAEIARMKAVDFFRDNDKEYIVERISRVFAEGRSDAEVDIINKEGAGTFFYFTGHAIRFENRICLIGMGIDISERKKAEETISLAYERYMLATKATNDAIWDWDIRSDIFFWGEALYSQFGYKPCTEVNKRSFRESRIHPADRERITNSISQFIDEKKKDPWSEEYFFQKSDGSYALVADRAFLVFDENGKLTRVVGSLEDITEKKELEKKLLQQELTRQKQIAQTMLDVQERERAEIGKELHDNVSQILSTTKLYLELVKNDTPERTDLIARSAENIHHAINEIRTISKALVPPSLGDLGLVESVTDLVDDIRATRLLDVEFYTGGPIDESIPAKLKIMLFRIIQEQVNNVLKHSESNKMVIELTLDEMENKVELSVSDNGIGFDPENIKAKKGLGLHNMTSRAELFGGKLAILSAPGQGCKLIARVPLNNL